MIELRPDRPAVSKLENGKISFRPSELGKCTRALAAGFLGHIPDPFDEDTQLAMKQGHIHEPHIAHDIELEYGGHVQRQIRLTMPIESWGSLDGTCDGVWFVDEAEVREDIIKIHDTGAKFDPYIIEYTGKWRDNDKKPTIFGVEIKASADSMFIVMSKDGPTYEYKWQISCYWWMICWTLGVEPQGFIFAVKHRESGRVTHQWIDKPFFDKQDIIDRCREIIKAAAKGLNCAESIECDRVRHDCKFWKIHKEEMGLVERDVAKIKGARFAPEVLEVALESYDLGCEIEYLKARQEILREQMDAARHHDKKIAAPGFRISQESRTYVDEKQLLIDHPEFREQYSSFDVKKCLEDHPHLEKKYQRSGRPYLVVREVKGELKNILSARVKANKDNEGQKTQKTSYKEIMSSDQGSEIMSRVLDSWDKKSNKE